MKNNNNYKRESNYELPDDGYVNKEDKFNNISSRRKKY
jgi:hypothetical protein